jgi:hypothetical protein
MAREFKPVRFFVMMALAAFVVCGVTSFYIHRAAHGRTAEERAAYAIGLKVGEQAQPGATLPTNADLNMMAQKYFKQRGPAISRLGTRASKTGTRTDSIRRIPGNEPATFADSETFPVDFLLDRSRPHRSLRVCADRIGDDMRMDRKFPRLQSG